MPIAGGLAASSIGWPSVFYVFGTLAIVWSIAFLYFGADGPSEHRSISQEERMYIEESLRTTETKSNDEVKQVKITNFNQLIFCVIWFSSQYNFLYYNIKKDFL